MQPGKILPRRARICRGERGFGAREQEDAARSWDLVRRTKNLVRRTKISSTRASRWTTHENFVTTDEKFAPWSTESVDPTNFQQPATKISFDGAKFSIEIATRCSVRPIFVIDFAALPRIHQNFARQCKILLAHCWRASFVLCRLQQIVTVRRDGPFFHDRQRARGATPKPCFAASGTRAPGPRPE